MAKNCDSILIAYRKMLNIDFIKKYVSLGIEREATQYQLITNYFSQTSFH